MHRITAALTLPLHDEAGTRALEQRAVQVLPPGALMQRAGLATARLARALAPHARTVWVACGPGNNGGDGLEAAAHLRAWGIETVVTWLGDAQTAPPDARAALQRARDAGVNPLAEPPPHFDFCIDALLGIGIRRAPEGRLLQWVERMNAAPGRVLSVDVPTGLDAGTGAAPGAFVHAAATLSLLALKAGLFTGLGRDAAGAVWFDSLGVAMQHEGAIAQLSGADGLGAQAPRRHASHKGSYGDVAVVGGAPGMAGAALLAASAALHGGAGRVFAALLDGSAAALDPTQPELMLRAVQTLDFKALTVVCGCGGGEAVRDVLARVLSSARELVLDADALNAIAADSQFQQLLAARATRTGATVLTPHPLEAARLLGTDAAQVQADRLHAARELAARFRCVAVLKGSGTVMAAPGRVPRINPTGNARLATAGTGDVLAGLIGARLAQSDAAFEAACQAVHAHGAKADDWPAAEALTASRLARA